MNARLLVALLSLVGMFAATAVAETSEVWGKAPEATDDRFSNPDKPLYAGPDGWWNTGEVRATTGGTKFGFKGALTENSDLVIAVKDRQTLSMDFGSGTRPAPGEYTIGAKGDAAAKTVRFSFSDVSGDAIQEWVSAKGAGTLTVKLVHGFTYFTCRGVTLQPSSGSKAAPMILGYEGALTKE